MLKKIASLFILLFALSVPAFATKITIPQQTVSNWRKTTTAPILRIYSNKTFTTTTGEIVPQGSPDDGNSYQEITCSIVGTTVTIPTFQIDSTTDGVDVRNATYSFFWFDSNGSLIAPVDGMGNIRVPSVIASTVGCSPVSTCGIFADLRVYNAGSPRLDRSGFYDKDEINALLSRISLPPVGAANQVFGVNAGANGTEYKTLSTGTSGTNFAIAHSANSITFNLPDASASARGAITTGTQTLAGAKIFSTSATGPIYDQGGAVFNAAGYSDIQTAINAAIAAGKPTVLLPPGTYHITSHIVIGDGNSTTASTIQGVALIGASGGLALNTGVGGDATAGLVNIVADNSMNEMILVNGPMAGLRIENIRLDCNNLALAGIRSIHARKSTYKNIEIREVAATGTGFVLTGYTTYPNEGTVGPILENIRVKSTQNNVVGFDFGVSSFSGSDVAQLYASNLVAYVSGTGTTGVILRGIDSSTFNFLDTKMATTAVQVIPPTGSTAFPDVINIYHAALESVGGSGTLSVTGSWTPSGGGIFVMPFSTIDGEAWPASSNIWGLSNSDKKWHGSFTFADATTFSTSISTPKITNLTSNGFVKTSSGDGTLSVDTTTYATDSLVVHLAGSETITGSKAFSSTPTFSTMTANSVLFAGTSGILSQDNANFNYNSSTHALTVGGPALIGGTTSSSYALEAYGSGSTVARFSSVGSPATTSAGIQAGTTQLPTLADQRLAFYTGGATNGLGTTQTNGAAITFWSGEPWTLTTNQGEYVKIETTPTGSATRAAAATFFGSGGVSVGSATDPGSGIVNANTGFKVANAATAGNVLRGDGTKFVSSTLAFADLSSKPTTFAGYGISDTSANLRTALTDETGSGAAVFATAPTIAGGSITGLTSLGIRDTSAAFDVTLAATSGTTLTAGRTLTFNMGNVDHTLAFGTTTGTLTFPVGTKTIPATADNLSVFASTTSAQLAGVLSDETGSGLAVFGTSPAFTTSQTTTRDSIGAASTDGIILQNTAAAAVGAQQWSPRLRLTGQGWKTDATAASQTVDWIAEVQPVQSTANPTSILSFSSQVNGGGYTEALRVSTPVVGNTNASVGINLAGNAMIGPKTLEVHVSETGVTNSAFVMHNRGAAAVNTGTGFLFSALNASSAQKYIGGVAADFLDITAGAEHGRLYFREMVAGTLSTVGAFYKSNLKIGSSTALRATTEGTSHIDIFDGTAPVGALTNGISLYSTAGELRVMDAAGNATLLSPHDHTSNEWIYYSVNTVTGKILKIDMERLIRALDKQLGGGFVHEYMSEVEARPDLVKQEKTKQ